MNRDRRRNQPHRPYGLRWWGANDDIWGLYFGLVPVDFKTQCWRFLIHEQMSSKAKMRTSNISAITETSSAKSRSVNTSWPRLTPTKPRWTERLLFATGLLLLDKMQETNNDAVNPVIHKRRALVSSVYLLYPWIFGCTEYGISVVEIVLRYIMQDFSLIWPTDWLILALSVICMM